MSDKLNMKDLTTYDKNTWCPGCGDFSIEIAAKQVFSELINEGKLKRENIVVLAGIGCHGKIMDYTNLNSFYSLHGRVPGPAEGVKLANPNLTVVGFSGDGDCYGEGLAHMIFAAKRNENITMIVHDNRVYGLTTGQYTPTSPKGFRGRSTPKGSPDGPLNPVEMMLVAGATFVGRTFSGSLPRMKNIIKEAILHRGFSVVDVLQVCVSYYNVFDYYKKRIYDLQEEKHDTSDWHAAMKKATEWDYEMGEEVEKIATGIFYNVESETLGENLLGEKPNHHLPIPELKEVLQKHV